jgi:hypothetical protein
MSEDVNSEPVLDGAIGPDVILVIVGVDDPFRGMLFKERHQLSRRVAAPCVDEQPINKVSSHPEERIPPISRLMRIWVISSNFWISITNFSRWIGNPFCR